MSIEAISIGFEGVKALDEVSFAVNKSEICGLIGPNGAGKTALFNCLSRICRPISGGIVYCGHRIEHHAQHDIVGLGIGRTFQNLAMFQSMTVLENVLVGGHRGTSSGYLGNLLALPGTRREEAALRQTTWEPLKLLELHHHAHRLVRSDYR